MTPREQAEKLVNKFLYGHHFQTLEYNGQIDMHLLAAKEAASTCVDEMIETGRQIYQTTHSTHFYETSICTHLREVKKEIQNL